ncbi:aspartate/glutamate racemase family protein [Derxia lacustris]|uniref:aspartate/glutamate racemase family protein n=1 Tax=Derxia lacustris TaxID=764842 RepID=UPI000A16E7F3|nr:aspartate/glutamate racemase family protein [Derxia lacustris]
MLIRVINPNTSAPMTAAIGAAAARVAAPGTRIDCVSPAMGPASIEGHYDEAIATVGLLEEIRAGELLGAAGHVVACFGDPGLDAAREIARAPVIGVAEAAMHLATLVATGFSVVTTLERTCIITEHLVHNYGFTRQCRAIRACEIAVLELEHPGSGAYERIEDECRRALREDRSGAIVLGCAGMAELRDRLQAALGVPVVEGVTAAVKLLEGLAALGLATSRHGDYAAPLAKPYAGLMARFAPGGSS